MRLLIIILAALLALPAAGQVYPQIGHGAPGVGGVRGFSFAGLVGLYTPGGCPGELNPQCRWWDAGQNLLLQSEDLTTTWAVVGSPVVTATTVEDDAGAAHEYVSQTIAAPDGTTYTRIIWVLKDAVAPATRFPRFRNLVGGSYNVHLDTQSGATTEAAGLSGSHTVTAEQIGGTDYWRVEITFTTDDASGIFMDVDPAYGANADLTTGSVAAVGTITVVRQQLNPGAVAQPYQKTTAQQVLHDWSGSGNDGERGSAAGSDTNDFTITTLSRNLLAPGSTEDLTGWSEAGGTIVTATTAEDDSAVAMPFLYQAASAPNATTWTWTVWALKDAVVPATRFPRFRVNVAATYVVHLDTSSGATTESVALGGSHTVVSDGSYWKLSLTFTTDDGNGISVRIYPAIGANADLTTVGNAAVGEITVLKQQLEVGSAATTYVNPATGRRVVADFTTDDYVTADALQIHNNSAYSVSAVFKGPAQAQGGIYTEGTTAQNTTIFTFGSGASATSKVRVWIRDDDGTTQLAAESATTAFDDAWHIVTWTDSDGAGALYVDGVADAVDYSYTKNAKTLILTTIGARGQAGYANFFDGQIALVAVYSRALGAAEVARATTDIARKQCSEFGRLCGVASRPWPAYGWLGLPEAPWVLADMHPLEAITDAIKGTYQRMGEVERWRARQ